MSPDSPAAQPARTGSLPVLLGLLLGIGVAAALVTTGLRRLDSVAGASLHYASALALSVAVSLPVAHANRAPIVARVTLALLLTFVLRRWASLWVNLEALAWGSGPAGELAVLALPLEGLLFGVTAAFDRTGAG